MQSRTIKTLIVLLLSTICVFIILIIIILKLRTDVSDIILIAGGYNENGNQDIFYELAVGSKIVNQLKLRLNQSRYGAVTGVCHGRFIISGGWDSEKALGSTEIYSMRSLELVTIDHSVSAKYSACGGVSDNKLYSCFGHDGAKLLDFCDVISLHPTDQFKYSHLKPQLSGRSSTCVMVGNEMYVIGGWLGGSVFTNDVFKFNLSSGVTARLASYPILQHHISSAVVYMGNIVVCGGKFNHHSNPYTNLCYQYNVMDNSWTSFAGMKRAKAGHQLINYGHDKLLAVGGYDKHAFIPTIELYSNGSWTYYSVLPQTLAKMSLIHLKY